MWTVKKLRLLASRCNTAAEMTKISKSAVNAVYRLGLADELFDHMQDGRENNKGKARLTEEMITFRLQERAIQVVGTYNGLTEPLPCLCLACGTEWSPRPTDLFQGCGCPSCANSGFQFDKPAYFYLYNIDDTYLGFGITGKPKRRHKTHAYNLTQQDKSFTLLDQQLFTLGRDAFLFESLVKKTFTRMDSGVEGFRKESISINNLETVKLMLTESLI